MQYAEMMSVVRMELLALKCASKPLQTLILIVLDQY